MSADCEKFFNNEFFPELFNRTSFYFVVPLQGLLYFIIALYYITIAVTKETYDYKRENKIEHYQIDTYRMDYRGRVKSIVKVT